VPPPDVIPSLKQAGFKISLWPYPHTYPYVWNTQPGSPFQDVRVRRALNYAIDREGLCKLINGTGKPATGLYPEDSPIFGKPKNQYTFDPARAQALLKEAGYGPSKPLRAKVMISTSGSGQMVPIPMNEFMQQNFKAVNVDITFDVVEWGTMLVAFRSAAGSTASHGVDAINISLSYTDPSSLFRCYDTSSFAPNGWNWGHYSNKQVDEYLNKAQATFDRAAQIELLKAAHEIVVDEAAWLFMVHDLNPRAMSAKVHNFQPAQSWAQDFTHITMG
jgi:ABC-type transport system substrate-binding protein